jgi:DNA invertase Pin-like site-specific DNA recombinase
MLAQRIPIDEPAGGAPLPSSEHKGLRVATWARQSTEGQSREQDGRAGLERQREIIARLAAGGQHTVVAKFELVDVSGTAVVEHAPEWLELTELIASKQIEAVICADLSRLMRVGSWQSLGALDHFARHRCLVITEGQTIDFSDPSGALTGGLFALLAAHERRTMLRKLNAAKEVLRKSGKNPGGDHSLPRGLRYDRKKQEFYYDPIEILKVQEAFRLLDPQGEGLTNITEVARRLGWKRGGLMTSLHNEAWLGFRTYDEKVDPARKRVGADGRQVNQLRTRREPHEIVRVKFTDKPAIDPAQHQRVMEVLKEVRRNSFEEREPTPAVSLCLPYGRCVCGAALYITTSSRRVKSTGEKASAYCCRSRHPAKKGNLVPCGNPYVMRHILDALLIAYCTKQLADAELLGSLIAGSIQRAQEVIRPFPTIKPDDELAKLQRREARLIEMCKAEAISIDELVRERAKLREEKARLQRVKPAQSTATPERMGIEEFVTTVVRWAVRLGSRADKRQQRDDLMQIFADVFFQGRSITAFRFKPSFLAALQPEYAQQLSHTVTLPKPFRTDPEIPATEKQCNKCGRTKPAEEFAKRRSCCKPCFLEAERLRNRRAHAKRKEKRGAS